MNRFHLLVTAAMLGIPVASPSFAGVPLDVAVRTGKVEVVVTGRGVSSGDSINLQLQKKTPGTLNIDIEPGTVFRDKSGQAQSMVFRRVRFEKVPGGYKQATEIVLSNDNQRHFVLEAYCRDHGKPTPRGHNQFVVEPTSKTEAAIIAHGTDINVTTKVMQVAIWIQRSGKDPAQLRHNFSVSSDEYRVATELVATAKRRPATSPAAVPTTEVDVAVELKQLMAGIRKRIQDSQASVTLRRGDQAKVQKAKVSMTATRIGKLVVAELSQGDEVEVVRVAGDRVLCVVKSDNQVRRGWLTKADLGQQSSPSTAPVGGLLRESALDVLDKIDINVQTNNTRVSVGVDRDP